MGPFTFSILSPVNNKQMDECRFYPYEKSVTSSVSYFGVSFLDFLPLVALLAPGTRYVHTKRRNAAFGYWRRRSLELELGRFFHFFDVVFVFCEQQRVVLLGSGRLSESFLNWPFETRFLWPLNPPF